MTAMSLNQTLAKALRRLMAEQGLSAKKLGLKAGVAPNTISNYCRADGTAISESGKERSAKLAEVERIAKALGVPPISLLVDPDEQAMRAARIGQLVAEQLGAYQAPPAASSGKQNDKAA